jgi:hypothetical protein
MKAHPILMVICCTALVPACSDRPGTQTTEDTAARTAEENDQALVRIVHAIPQAPPADVYTGDQKAFSGVQFGEATAYKPVPEEAFKLTLKAAGAEPPPVMIEAQPSVDPGGRYTVLAMPDRDGAARIDVFPDELTTPAPDKALVRVIHAAPEAGSVAVYSARQAADPEIEDVDYAAPARYEEVVPGDVSVSIEARTPAVKPAPSKAPAVVTQARIEPGKTYTLVVAPPAEPGKPAQMIQIEDALATGKRPALQGEGEAEIQPGAEAAHEVQNP